MEMLRMGDERKEGKKAERVSPPENAGRWI